MKKMILALIIIAASVLTISNFAIAGIDKSSHAEINRWSPTRVGIFLNPTIGGGIMGLSRTSIPGRKKAPVTVSTALRTSQSKIEKGETQLKLSSEYPTEEELRKSVVVMKKMIKELKRSIIIMKKMIRDNPNSEMAAELQYQIAEIFTQLGKQEWAKREYSRVVANYPGTPWANLASEKIP